MTVDSQVGSSTKLLQMYVLLTLHHISYDLYPLCGGWMNEVSQQGVVHNNVRVTCRKCFHNVPKHTQGYNIPASVFQRLKAIRWTCLWRANSQRLDMETPENEKWSNVILFQRAVRFDCWDLTPSLPPACKISWLKSARTHTHAHTHTYTKNKQQTNKQYIFRPITLLVSILCIFVKILAHAAAKNKTKEVKDFQFHILIGRFQMTWWQWKG